MTVTTVDGKVHVFRHAHRIERVDDELRVFSGQYGREQVVMTYIISNVVSWS